MRTFEDIVQKARQHESYWVEAALYDFTETVCGLLEDSGMTRTELAQKLGVTSAYITKLLRGDANVTIKTMVRLARVFGRQLQIALPQQQEGQGKLSVAVMQQTEHAWRFELPRDEYSPSDYTQITSSSQPVHTYEKESLAA